MFQSKLNIPEEKAGQNHTENYKKKWHNKILRIYSTERAGEKERIDNLYCLIMFYHRDLSYTFNSIHVL